MEIFCYLNEVQLLIEQWRLEYSTFGPHSSLKYQPRHPKHGITEGHKNEANVNQGIFFRGRSTFIVWFWTATA